MLGNTINKMARDLKKTVITNEELEKKIAERTKALKLKNQRLERYIKATEARELKMAQLKKKLKKDPKD